jgi:hypothetical protein
MTATTIIPSSNFEVVIPPQHVLKSTQGSQEDYESSSDDEFFTADCIDGVGPYDVLCGRQKEAFRNVGNRRFRVTVGLSLDKYIMAPTRQCKSKVIILVADQVKANGGRFLKWKNREWVELDEKQSREKVGHALRDMASARESVANRKTLKRKSVEPAFVRNPKFFYTVSRCYSNNITVFSTNESNNMQEYSRLEPVKEVTQGSCPRQCTLIDNYAVAAGMHRLSYSEPLDAVENLIDWEDLLDYCEA